MDISALNDLSNVVVRHQSFNHHLEVLNQQFHLRQQGYKQSQGIALLGESGLGKTTLLNTFMKAHPILQTDEGTYSDIIFVTVPPNPTGTSLCSAILEGLRDPFSHNRDTESKKRSRVIRLIKDCNVSVIILDEIQHFSNRWGQHMRHDATDSFKVIMDETKIMMVLSGLQYGSALFKENEQFSRRFTHNLNFERFKWNDAHARSQFRGFLTAIQKDMPHFPTVELSAPETAFRFYVASGGLASLVKSIIEKAAMNAYSQGKQEISLEDYAVAFEGISAIYQGMNPFTVAIDEKSKEKLLLQASAVGVVTLPNNLNGKAK